MNRLSRGALAIAAMIAGTVALHVPAAEAASRGELKVCAYNYDGRVTVRVGGNTHARFPSDGNCESEKIRAGDHRLSTSRNNTFESGQVLRKGSRYTFYDLPAKVRVSAGKQTRVNLYFF